MSYKQAVPLLDPEEDDLQSEDESEDENPFTPDAVKVKTGSKYKIGSEFCSWKHCLFLVIVTMIVLGILLLAVSLPFALKQDKPQAPSPTITPSPTVTPLPSLTPVAKSPHDARQYGYYKLGNGLRVLLISDNETQLSAAAMDIAVGSFSDPLSHQGLAHFCEHMLFYGSKKYPEEGAYSNYLTHHGGYDNAYTYIQNTNYFFRVGSNYLREALDRFAQFFISPILSQSGVSREVNAVDAEHRKNLQSDSWRFYQLMRHVSNPRHPFHQFSTGDLETLDKPDVLSALKSFYDQHYSANQMQLVIYGKEDLATLSQYSQSMFSSVRNKNATRDTFTNTSFPPPFNGKIVYYVPVAETNALKIFWQVTPLRQKYREKVGSVLSQIIGHEGPGSAAYYLKKQRWITALSAGIEISTDSYTLFGVYITLTQSGLAHSNEVIATVIQYIKLLQGLNEQQWKQQWNDFVDVSIVRFNYSSKISPDGYTSGLADIMRNVESPKDFLDAPHRFIFNHSLISSVVSSLSPSTSIIFIGSHNLTDPQASSVNLPLPQSLSSVEPIYGTQYEAVLISPGLVSTWSQNVVAQELSLPKPNQYIPRDFTILNTSTATPHPIKIDPVEDGYSVWWQQDAQFLQPKLNLVCNIYSPISHETITDPRWTALTRLYAKMVLTSLDSLMYPATLLDYSVSINAIPHGLNVIISGYSDSTVMNNIIELVVNAMTNETMLSNSEMFSLSLESMTDSLTNYNYTAIPYRYIYQYIQSIVMNRPKWKNWQLLQLLKDVNTSVLLRHKSSLLDDSATLLCLVHGNVDKNQALKYGRSFFNALSSSSMIDPKGTLVPKRRISLSPGNYSVIVPTLNPMDTNSVVNVVFQIGIACNLTSTTDDGVCSNSSLKRRAIASLLTLQIKQSCFDVLRTQQQLGYVAYCTLRQFNNVLSFQVLVQSGTYNASLLLERIDQFLKDSLQNLTKSLSSSSKFDALVEVYREVLRQKDLSLLHVTTKLWDQLDTGLNQFNYQNQLENVLPSITPTDIINFYTEYILDSRSARKLVIAAYGKEKKETLDTRINNELDYTALDPSATSYP